LQVAFTWWRKRTVPQLTLWSGLLMMGFGGATLYFHSPTALMWMPSVLYGTLALVFAGSHLTRATVIERVIGQQLLAPKRIWTIANATWVAFFIALALVNYWVLSHYALDTWVWFKLIKVGIVFVFAIVQALWLAKVATVREDATDKTSGAP
jgi:intracellular septation protein